MAQLIFLFYDMFVKCAKKTSLLFLFLRTEKKRTPPFYLSFATLLDPTEWEVGSRKEQ